MTRVSCVKQAAIATVSLGVSGGGAALTVFNDQLFPPPSLAGRVSGGLAPTLSGAALYAFFKSICPSPVMHRVQIESLRLGIPGYFLLTQIYLNTPPEQRGNREAVIASMLALFGFESAALADTLFVKVRPEIVADTEALLNDTEPKRTYTLLTDGYVGLAGRIAYRLIPATGLLLGAIYVNDAELEACMFSFSAFYYAQSLTLFPLNMLMRGGTHLENRFAADLESDATTPLPRSLRLFRTAQNLVMIATPTLIASLFIDSQWPTVAAAGICDTVREEVQRLRFTQSTEKKMGAIGKRLLHCTPLKALDTSYKITAYLAMLGGLAYFAYLLIDADDPAYTVIAITFTASVLTGFLKNSLLIELANKVKGNRLVDHLLYNGAYSTQDILGMQMLYLYYYSLFRFKMGSDHLTPRELTLQAVTWGAYGWSGGASAARVFYSSTESTSMWNWLLGNLTLTTYQRIMGIVV
ncbi:MAG: hypothetical protein S4CHLAM2_00650 [Chlamydiales bacterium]|nr:hypothetical protein [Chlamydiales bacterium]